MAHDIFAYWADVPADAQCHPDDKPTLDRVAHRFHLECPPAPIKGPLRTAPVVLLALSPGFAEADIPSATSASGLAYNVQSRSGTANLPTPEEHGGSARWAARIIKQFGVDYESARDKVAILNIGAYHSASFDDWPMLAALASSRAALDWAQSVLFPQAETGERAVVCLRSARYWGLSRGDDQTGTVYGKALFVPACTPGGVIHHGDGELRGRIIEAVQERCLGGSFES